MERLNKIWEAILKIWKDPVWSKVISAGIILLIATIWTKYSNYSGQDVYNFFILLLTYKLPVFVFLSVIGLYFLTKLLELLHANTVIFQMCQISSNLHKKVVGYM